MGKTVHKQYRIKHRAARKKGQTKVCPFLFHNPHRGVLAAEPYPPNSTERKGQSYGGSSRLFPSPGSLCCA